ncbi:MAG: hypothetical protein QW036_02190 [Zestosphaera sp.]
MVQYLEVQSFFFGRKSSRHNTLPYPVLVITLISLASVVFIVYLIWVLFNEGFYYSLYLLIPLYISTHFFLVGVKSLLKGWS